MCVSTWHDTVAWQHGSFHNAADPVQSPTPASRFLAWLKPHASPSKLASSTERTASSQATRPLNFPNRLCVACLSAINFSPYLTTETCRVRRALSTFHLCPESDELGKVPESRWIDSTQPFLMTSANGSEESHAFLARH